MDEPIVVGIDIGTTKVCTLVARLEAEAGMRILGVGIDKDGQSFYSDDDGASWHAGGATSHAITTGAVFYDNQMIYANGLLIVGGTAGQISTSDEGFGDEHLLKLQPP